VSTVSDQSPVLHHMAPLPAATPARSDPIARPAINHVHSQNNGEHGRLSQPVAAHSAREQQVEVRIIDIMGNGISGILYKWVNYGKGWRPRWFVLQDGVLSYYKIHGPDKIVVNRETEKGSKVIGEESNRRISRQNNGTSLSPQQPLPRKPFGEIHLKVLNLKQPTTQ
jgi:hypothetical protein